MCACVRCVRAPCARAVGLRCGLALSTVAAQLACLCERLMSFIADDCLESHVTIGRGRPARDGSCLALPTASASQQALHSKLFPPPISLHTRSFLPALSRTARTFVYKCAFSRSASRSPHSTVSVRSRSVRPSDFILRGGGEGRRVEEERGGGEGRRIGDEERR